MSQELLLRRLKLFSWWVYIREHRVDGVRQVQFSDIFSCLRNRSDGPRIFSDEDNLILFVVGAAHRANTREFSNLTDALVRRPVEQDAAGGII